WGPAREDDEGRDEAGLYCWCVECPEEGSVRLDETPIPGRDGLQHEPGQQPEARGVVDEAPPRYVCLKAEGSRYAYVNDTQEARTVKRYDILRRYGGVDGWSCG